MADPEATKTESTEDGRKRRLRLVNRPDAPHIYADGFFGISMSQGVAHVTLFSDRPAPGEKAVVDRITVGHISMPVAAVSALRDQIGALLKGLGEMAERAKTKSKAN
jgi:hypothetical protein